MILYARDALPPLAFTGFVAMAGAPARSGSRIALSRVQAVTLP